MNGFRLVGCPPFILNPGAPTGYTDNSLYSTRLRILAGYEAKIAKICQLLDIQACKSAKKNHLFEIRQKALLADLQA